MHRPRSTVWVAAGLLVAISAAGCSRKPTPASGAGSPSPSAAALDWGAVDRAMGRPATALDGGVHRYGLPRTDLSVHLGDVALKPAFALGSYLAFDQFYIMTHGGPENKTFTTVMRIVEAGFTNFQLGYAGALSIALLFILLIINVVQLYIMRGTPDE